MLVQLAKVYRLGITDTFLDLQSPPWGLPKYHFIRKSSRFATPNSPKPGLFNPENVIRWPKMNRFGPEYSIWMVTTGKIPYLYGFFGLSRIPKGLYLLT